VEVDELVKKRKKGQTDKKIYEVEVEKDERKDF
jgi:hypothetical protein